MTTEVTAQKQWLAVPRGIWLDKVTLWRDPRRKNHTDHLWTSGGRRAHSGIGSERRFQQRWQASDFPLGGYLCHLGLKGLWSFPKGSNCSTVLSAPRVPKPLPSAILAIFEDKLPAVPPGDLTLFLSHLCCVGLLVLQPLLALWSFWSASLPYRFMPLHPWKKSPDIPLFKKVQWPSFTASLVKSLVCWFYFLDPKPPLDISIGICIGI